MPANHETLYVVDAMLRQLKDKLGMDSLETLQTWLRSDAVDPYFQEFVRDYLSAHRNDGDGSYEQITNMLGVNQIIALPSYDPAATPNKEGSSINKHWTRLIAQMYGHNSRHVTPWKAPREEDLEIAFFEAFEVVIVLKKQWLLEHQE